MSLSPRLTALCRILGAASLLGAGLYLALGEDKGTGIFLVIIAALAGRFLVLGLSDSSSRSS